MSKRKKSIASLLLALILVIGLLCSPVMAAEQEDDITITEASYTSGVVTVIGTVEPGSDILAVAVLIYRGNTLVRLETTGVDNDGNFSAAISIALSAGTYTVKVADYNGGPYAEAPSFTVAAPPSGGAGASGPASGSSDNKAVVSGGVSLDINVDTKTNSAKADLGTIAGNLAGNGTTEVTFPSIPGVSSYTVSLPASSLAGSSESELTINTETGSISVPGNMLSGTGLTGTAEITIGAGDKESLPDDVKAAIGDKPLIKLTLSVDGTQTSWSNPNAPVTVSIPYTPTAEELANPEGIVVWYIDGSGNIVTIPNGRYDPETGKVTFSTTHFSDFAVAYNDVSFSDVTDNAWYSEAVKFIAAREITKGTGDGKYSPDMKLTRGQFIVLIMRAYGIEPDTNPTGNFSDSGNTYYTNYVAAAKGSVSRPV